jgi:ribonuclease P/MRP protein subunit RPP40
VVQGSVLGPLLFLLYINDVAEAFRDSKCTCKLYADDLQIYTEIQLADDLNLLQSALDALYEWSDRWQLSISYKKCSAILINAREQAEEFINANPAS